MTSNGGTSVPQPAGSPRGATRLALVLALIVVLNALFASWTEARKYPGVDFLVYWSVARAVENHDVADLYSPEGRAELTDKIAARASNPYLPERVKQASELVLGFEKNSIDVVATPFLFSVLSLWEHGDYDRDLALFTLTCIIAFSLSIAGLGRTLGFGALTSALFIALFSLGFGPYASDLRVANINQIQLFSAVLFLWILKKPSNRRDIGAGLVLGASIMFRPSIALVALFLAVVWLANGRIKRTGRVIAGTLAGAVAAVLISSLYFGTLACWGGWLRVAPALLTSKDERGKGGLDYGNYGLVAVLRNILSVDTSVVILITLSCASAFVVWRGRVLRKSVPDKRDEWDFFQAVAAVCLGLTFVLLSSTLVWFHYMVMAIPAILLALAIAFPAARAGTHTSALAVLAVAGLVCLTRFPLEALPLPLTVEVTMLNVGILAISAVIMYALAAPRPVYADR